jgi:hypothetical protein
VSVETDIPAAGQNALVKASGSTGAICAKGSASRAGGVYPTAIYAKVYTQNPGTVPTPPADATGGTLVTNADWQFTGAQEIPGANCASQSPYPQNWLLVWAKYDSVMYPYDVDATTFNGECSTKTDCD